MPDEDPDVCSKCGSLNRVAYCPAWDVSYCESCRLSRADAELCKPVTILPVRPA